MVASSPPGAMMVEANSTCPEKWSRITAVGPVLRVDRRPQPMGNALTALDFGYVFLSDNGGQAGLLGATLLADAIEDA